MSEERVINGRKATITYLHADFTPGTEEDHTFVEARFENGEKQLLEANYDGENVIKISDNDVKFTIRPVVE